MCFTNVCIFIEISVTVIKGTRFCDYLCYKGDNLKNAHARVMVLVHDTSLNVLYKCMKFH